MTINPDHLALEPVVRDRRAERASCAQRIPGYLAERDHAAAEMDWLRRVADGSATAAWLESVAEVVQ